MSEEPGTAPARARAAGAPSLGMLLTRNALMGLVLAAVLILGSGRVSWLRAWLYVAITCSVQAAAVIVLHRKDPDLLVERRRMQAGTKRWDKVLAPAVAIVGPLGMWLAAAIDVRVHWPPIIPAEWSAAAFVFCLAGSTVVFRAMLENRFFSATVRIQSERGHVLVESGPYGHVRHPGYAGALVFTVATPVALGSWWALVPAAATAIALVVRTALEDATLRVELPGYAEYALRVRWRLVPGLW